MLIAREARETQSRRHLRSPLIAPQLASPRLRGRPVPNYINPSMLFTRQRERERERERERRRKRSMGQEASNGSNDRRLTTGSSGRQTISAALHQVLSVNDHNASCKPIRGKAAIRMPGHAPPWITFAVPTAPLFPLVGQFSLHDAPPWFTLRRHHHHRRRRRHSWVLFHPPYPFKSRNRVAGYRESP